MKTVIKSGLFILTILLVSGCSQINGDKSKVNNKVPTNRLTIKIKDIHRKDSLEYGEIVYKSKIMDTLQLKKNDKRYLWFHYGIYDKPYNIDDLKGKTTESYEAINDSVIPFDSKYSKPGVYYLEGYIEEVFLLPEYDENGNMRKLDNFIKISKKIKIVDK
ncbi:hypothetical protein [Aquimarina sp. RZ0]|uniref:hypothetical protein n=1 Tax=Aquimarina sp. RZ0 TaxID=2607730 RepID=UPI0011F0DD53|nr:hypothetical protein [Aquimarina sp. RZ0]KAA1240795.1 hypothetical protein F0000_26830 [Aquimarina sp. RZ0]